MNKIILQHTGKSTREDFIRHKYTSWAVKETREKVWRESVGATLLLIEGGYVFSVATIEKIDRDKNSEYPLIFYWNNSIQFVKIPLPNFNEIVGYKRNYTRIGYQQIKEEYTEQAFAFLSEYLLKAYDDEEQYQQDVQDAIYKKIEDKPILKKELLVSKNDKKVYPRNPANAKSALLKAGFKCEIDEKHLTFTNKSSNENFTEAHHLIPLSRHEDFNYDLDVTANIVSLCPTCHRMIHLGCESDVNILLKILYEKRIKRLKRVNLNIELEELQYLYSDLD